MLEDSYFSTPPPKSTGREYFNKFWLEKVLGNYAKVIDPQDVQATLVELTATSISQAIQGLLPSGEVIVCGGGARNRQLMQSLASQLGTFKISSSNEHGINSDALEAFAFAWFAKLTMQGRPIDLCDITGSSRPHILGGVYYAD